MPVLGPPDAPVTIVEWADYACPFTVRAEPTLEQLFAKYPDRLRRVWRHNLLPFHPEAGPAAELAAEGLAQGGNAAFWILHRYLIADPRAKSRRALLTRPNLESYAEQSGLDLARVKKSLDQHSHATEIAADQTAALELGVLGTPAFFINGRFVAGAEPSRLTEVVEDELRRTARLIQLGVPAKNIYAAILENASARELPSVVDSGHAGYNDSLFASCNSGDANECVEVGVNYDIAVGVVRDPRKAAFFYQKACERNDPKGCSLSALHDSDGDRSGDQIFFLTRACDGGFATFCFMLASHYDVGDGVRKNRQRADVLYKKACDLGEPAPCFVFGARHQGKMSAESFQKGLASFERSCDAGSANACLQLGLSYGLGRGVAKDSSKAASLYEKACGLGAPPACTLMGLAYDAGHGVGVDSEQAHSFFSKACNGGDEEGCRHMADMNRSANPVPPSIGFVMPNDDLQLRRPSLLDSAGR
jgi:TPR repeat protein